MDDQPIGDILNPEDGKAGNDFDVQAKCSKLWADIAN
jgi:hypothetical protein